MQEGMTLKQIQDEVCKRCFKDSDTFRNMIKSWVNLAQHEIGKICSLNTTELTKDEDISIIPKWRHYLLIEYAVWKGHEFRRQDKMAILAKSNWVEGIFELEDNLNPKGEYNIKLENKL